MLIDMWRTTKRENSTATPVSQPGWFTNHVQYDVKLKEKTSVLNPSFILNIPGHDGQNYLWAFGRYYWVTEITSLANNLWQIDCKIDPLGSYRGHIRNTQAYVLYDSTPNTEIPDNRLGVRTTATYSTNEALMPWGFNSSNGSKFIAIEGDGDLVTSNDAESATGVYKVTDTTISQLGMPFNWNEIWSVFEDVYENEPVPFQRIGHSGDTLSSLSQELDQASTWDKFGLAIEIGVNYIPVSVFALFKAIKGLLTGGDALKHVKAAYWLPFSDLGSFSSFTKIALGSYVDTLSGAERVDSPIKSENVDISIPWQFSDWRNVQNTEIQLFIPLIGVIHIPSSSVKGHNSLTIMCGLNLYSGAFAVKIRCGQTVLGTYGANVASPILIGDSNANAPAITNTVVSAAAMVAGAAVGAGAVTAGALAGTIQSGLNCIQPISTSVGAIGGGIGNSLGHQIWCTTICHNTSDNPANLLSIIGTPTNVLKTLTGSGYCQTMQAHMNMNAVTGESYPTASEVEMVDRALDSGVFLE